MGQSNQVDQLKLLQKITLMKNCDSCEDNTSCQNQNIDVCETLMPPFPNMTFDLYLWPTDLKINRDHLLIKDYLPTKFEAFRAKPSWVISCTRLRATDIPTYRPTYRLTGATQYAPPFSKGISCIVNYIPWLKCLIFLCFWIELCKTLEHDEQEIKISTRVKKFHFLGKIAVLSKTKMIFWKILIFATHGIMTIFNNSNKTRTLFSNFRSPDLYQNVSK